MSRDQPGPAHGATGAARFLWAMLLAMVGWAGLVLGLIFAVDPYGLRPLDDWTGFIKKEDPWKDGRATRLALLLQQPKTIILGSSRVVLGVDETRLRDTAFWPAYNASTYNASLAHRLSTLRYAALLDRRLKHVLIEISPIDVIHSATFWRLAPIEFAPVQVAAEAASV